MDHVVAKIAEGGRIVIPAAMRKTLNLEIGDEVILRVREGELVVMGRAEALRSARQLVRQKVKSGVSLVDELLQDRRRDG